MKFNIFKWWESWVKPIVYLLILLATVMLIVGYCLVTDDGGTIAFVTSIVYACMLFFITVPINRINNYVVGKLYEREAFYLTLKRLRDVTNSTIEKADYSDLKDLRNHVFAFQVFTGRAANMIEARAKGEKVPVYIKEKGFIYTSEMLQLETKFLKLYEEDSSKKELLKNAKKLCKFYKKSCKRLEHTYNKIAQIYGGVLFELIERDSTASDTEYSLSDIGAKVDGLISELSLLKSDLEDLSVAVNDTQRDLFSERVQLADKLMDIESVLLDLADKNEVTNSTEQKG